MAGIGEAASILAFVLLAVDISKKVYSSVESFKSQRREVRDIQGELSTLTSVLQAISQQIPDPPADRRFEPLRQPVQCCKTICEEMQAMLDECSKHTKDSRDSVRDWLKMQYRGKGFNDMKQRLAAYKSTLSITFDSINLYVLNVDLRKDNTNVLRQNQGITQEALDALKASIEGTKDDLEDQLSSIRDSTDDASATLQAQLRTDQTQLQNCLDRLIQAQATVETTRPQINISRNTAGQNARAIFGTDNVRPTFDMTATDNNAQAGSTMAAGVHSPETLQALLRGNTSSAADIMAILQMSQNASASSTSEQLQSMLASRAGSQGTPIAIGGPNRNQRTNLIASSAENDVEDPLSGGKSSSRILKHTS